jgi:hypothetical protein
MKIESLRSVYDKLDEESSGRLTRLLNGIEEGRDDVLLSPLGESTDPDVILKGWDKIFDSNTSEMNDILLELEANNRSKYGPRSIAVPWEERRQGVLSSFSEPEKGVKSIKWRPPEYKRLRPISVGNAIKYIKRQTNAGLPTLEKKGTVLDKMDLFSFTIWNLVEEADRWASVMFTRTQENNKTRTVWGYPLALVILEMMFYRPILEYQRTLSWRAALRSPEDVDRAITTLIINALEAKKYIVSIDFSAFDDSIKFPIQYWVFYIYFNSLFQDGLYTRYRGFITDKFRSIPLVTPDGVYTGFHGIPSGSAFTNEAGSVSQHGIAKDYFEPLEDEQQQGDDGVYSCYYPEKLKEHFRQYGLEVNDSKSYVSKEFCVYLQNLYHIDYIDNGIISGIYPTYRALCRIVYQERFNDFSKDDISGKDYYAIRTLSILETCKHHPLFRELVRYVWTLDKYNLSFSDQGLVAYVKMREKQDGKDVKFTEYKRGDKIQGIREFASYQLVQEFNE